MFTMRWKKGQDKTTTGHEGEVQVSVWAWWVVDKVSWAGERV